MTGLDTTKEDILKYIQKSKNPYLTPMEIEQKRWLAGASHCTIRNLMKSNKIPSIKVGTDFRAHYLDIIEYLKKCYRQKSL